MIKTNCRRCATILTLILFLAFSSIESNSQTATQEQSALATWVSLDAPAGWEQQGTETLLKVLPGWQRDSLGNLVLHKGTGSPRRVVACGIDRPGFAVTEITSDGYLRLREVGSLRPHPLWIQFHEGQRIRIITRTGNVPGVVTVKSTHLQRRTANAPVTTLDDLWVDVGASSRSQVEELGIRMLDPVVRDVSSWTYAGYIAGTAAASRVGCAAVASVSQGEVTSGETIFLITTLRSFGNDGFAAALSSLGRIDEVTLLGEPLETSSDPISARKIEKPTYLPASTGLSSLSYLAPRVLFSGTLIESVEVSGANALLHAVERAAAVRPGTSSTWLTLSPRQRVQGLQVDSHSNTATLLKSLADVPSVSGHERLVREKIIASLPAWARAKATTDVEGNIVVAVGPDRDAVMFIAHLDEVGFEITSIADDGAVSLRTRGGLFQSLWEGQPALLHFDGNDIARPPLSGVFVPRETAATKQPETITAWFGVDEKTLKELGVSVGQSVTAYKSATRLAANRFTARALDDRAGSTALILAARRINPSLLKHRLILAWSVREETGLEGATVLAKRYASSVKRVFSVDTFVSSDSPVETTRFAFAPLGSGAVIRGLDNSSVANPAEIDRIVNIARMNRIPLQVGATNGGTDGSEFVPYGVVHVSLSWPGRYSHSPVEVLDLRDLEALARLITKLSE